MVSLFSNSDYPQVRAAIGLDIDSTVLPDETIALGIFKEAAQAEVLLRYPAATQASMSARRAAILLTAARIAPRIPWLVRERRLDYDYQRQEVDWVKLGADLRQQAEVELAALTDAGSYTAIRPTVFAAAAGRRGA